MSLIPYHPREGSEIVLRHNNAIVVRNRSSRRLEIRGLPFTECPTCHQPLRSASPERHFDGPIEHESYVDPDYFRMLRAGHHEDHADLHPPSSPIRRLVEPVQRGVEASPERDYGRVDASVEEAEFVSSTPAVQEGSRIRRDAFSPKYFSTFFIEERELGRGGKGVVLLVRHEIDGCSLGYFACKRVPVGDDHAWLEKVLVEVELLAKLSHPNLVSYRHVWLEDVKLSRFAPSVACAFILQQYCNGGDLLHYVVGELPKEATKEDLKAQIRRRSKGQADRPHGLLQPQRRLPFEEIYSLFKDITSGLAYLHGANYIHRDLKPSNCLIHREGNRVTCLISDFGEVQPENMARKSTGSTGTISYCAPEVLRRDLATGGYGNFTTKSDIFSLGMILYFMCFGRLPYQSANTVQEELEDIDQLRAEITDWKGFQDERRERPDLPSKLYQLLKRLLALSPAERPSASEVLGVMKNETSMDGISRSGATRSTSPSVGMAGRRIQNLDSPMPPSTPVPDPSKHARVTSSSDEDPSTVENFAPSRGLQTGLLKRHSANPSSSRHRGRDSGTSMAISRTQDGYSRSGSRSPERSLGGALGAHLSESPLTSPMTNVQQLLMPPPATRLGSMRQQALIAKYRAGQWVQRNADVVALSTRLAIFIAKVLSLSAACWPFSFQPSTGVLLVVIAALDLVISGSAVHANERAPRDMARTRVGDGEVTTTSSSLSLRVTSWPWNWRMSGVLLALHFLALWVTSRYAALCAASPHDTWVEW